MPETRILLYVEPAGPPSSESAAALKWLREQPGYDVRAVTLPDVADALLGYGATVWFHWTETPELDADARLALDAHVRAGGGLLATLAGATLPYQLGWEETEPNEVTAGPWAEDAGDELARSFSQVHRIRGLQSFRGHPLFEGLGSGAYTWAPAEGEPFVRYAYAGASWPGAGRVIAVEKSYISMNPDRRLAWEHLVGDGWALGIGGYVNFAAHGDRYRPHLERLIHNALRRVASNGQRARLLGGAWRPPTAGLKQDPLVSLPPSFQASGAFETTGDLVLERAAADVEYTLAGSRAMLAGRERSGHEEIWFHPFRAVSRWRCCAADSVSAKGDAANGSNPAAHYRIEPGVITRRLEIEGKTIEERTTVAPEAAAVLVELSPADGPVRLRWSLESDLRLMWPYPAGTAGLLSYRSDGAGVGVQAESGEWLGVRIDPAPAELTVSDASDDKRSRVRVVAEIELAVPTRILVVGATAVEEPPVVVDPGGWAAPRQASRLPAPGAEPGLAQALEWARWRLSTYRVHVPGLGTSLVAGYGRSRPGSFGDGRPGYAWFFGRDACWTALACLAAGQADAARQVVEFLGQHQDITGKILHECTTSGVIHYDAADSTPLYLLLAARYLAATGDRATIEEQWPRVLKAYEFCLSTDSDGDGLIENTGVGHGWVEFGRLGEHHVSLYLAGVWTAALAELETAARTLGQVALADELAFRAAAARASLELSFFEPLEGRYAHGRRADGSLNMAETIMTAVPLLLGAVRRERCEKWLHRVASDDFTAPWGVRLIPRSHPEYRPDGYHAGSAWPLYTGWVSLAEAAAGRAEAARRHRESLARLYTAHALGAWPEVLHGEEPRSVGVTSDQAWSVGLVVLAASLPG
ncbi:MAG TPA: GH116 family glycosyl hydrolase [Gemmatimonadota bacterium]|nr:GH116 family glycosyl hydrolase [Gemmatimonadota bacterium]